MHGKTIKLSKLPPKPNQNPLTHRRRLLLCSSSLPATEQTTSQQPGTGMPGPGAHLLYALSGGAALSRVAGPGRFGPHHCVVYAANAFLGPDLGSFAEWLCSFLPSTSAVGGLAMAAVHHPFYYPLLLGLPLAWAYAWLSRRLLRAGILDSPAGVALNKRQCFLLISAGSLSHFFLDHLFEENGHSTMYSWILSTGWWEGRAPINPDAVVVVGLLCICLMGGFVYINRMKHGMPAIEKSNRSFYLILVIASLYCMWCASQIYLRQPSQPAIGEEADLGVIIFLAIYLFLPHGLCVLSMNHKDYTEVLNELPLR